MRKPNGETEQSTPQFGRIVKVNCNRTTSERYYRLLLFLLCFHRCRRRAERVHCQCKPMQYTIFLPIVQMANRTKVHNIIKIWAFSCSHSHQKKNPRTRQKNEEEKNALASFAFLLSCFVQCRHFFSCEKCLAKKTDGTVTIKIPTLHAIHLMQRPFNILT